MNTKKDYRLVCDMEGLWTIQTRVELPDHRCDWMTIHNCTAKGREGYNEAKQWMEENL